MFFCNNKICFFQYKNNVFGYEPMFKRISFLSDLVETTTENIEKCMKLFVQNAGHKLKFHLSQFLAEKFSAKNALLKNKNNKMQNKTFKNQKKQTFFKVCFFIRQYNC